MGSARVPFQAHLELLQLFLARRDEIVENIQALLNAQRKAASYLQDGALLARHFEDCFFTGVTESQWRLRGELEAAHWASGFRPREIAGLHNGPADPAELMMRAFYMWQQTRWPGRAGRVRYAHTLFNLYAVRCLELLTMRVWDEGSDSAADRLTAVQGVLDHLWRVKSADQPAFVKDARWLIPLAQSLATDDLAAYFEVAQRVADRLPRADRIEIHKAGVCMAGGHLRSQIRYHAISKGLALGDPPLVLGTRNSNALDFALLIQELVPLLEAYEDVCQRDDRPARLALADAICQGVSPDPELFLNRVELLGPYSMIEHLFITSDADGDTAYTPMGRRHVQLIDEYKTRIARVATRLSDDCPHFAPAAGAYSPYGVLYGFSSDLVKHMALKASQPDAVHRFSLEDVFAAGDADTLAWVNGWRTLPHLPRQVEKQFEYPRQFAEEIFNRVDQALRRRIGDDTAGAGVGTGRLFVLPSDQPQAESQASQIPHLPTRYIRSSDEQVVSAHEAEPSDETQLLNDRQEGKFLVSYQTSGGWVAISKTVLTEVLGAGRDAKLAGLPRAAAHMVKLMYPDLVVRPETVTGCSDSAVT